MEPTPDAPVRWEMDAQDFKPPDWSNVTEPMAREILDRGERYLHSLQDVAASIDSRSSTLAGIFTAAAVAVLAVLGAGLDAPQIDVRLLASGFAVATVWFSAAWLCIGAILPAPFHVPGIHPEKWYAISDQPLNEVLGHTAEEYQNRINYNLANNKKATTKLKWGARLGAAAPAVGVVAWLVTWLVVSMAGEALVPSAEEAAGRCHHLPAGESVAA